jgi:hypothetical protein
VPWQCGPTSSSMQMPSACLRALSRQFRPSLTTLAFVPPLPSFTCDLLARLFSTLISRLSFPARQCHSMSLRRVYSWTSSWRWWCSSRRRRCERGCTLRLGCMRGRLLLFGGGHSLTSLSFSSSSSSLRPRLARYPAPSSPMRLTMRRSRSSAFSDSDSDDSSSGRRSNVVPPVLLFIGTRCAPLLFLPLRSAQPLATVHPVQPAAAPARFRAPPPPR